ncbi:MAG TPA: peptidoglycan-binding domain-containing protein [Jiangellaceae bacterium]
MIKSRRSRLPVRTLVATVTAALSVVAVASTAHAWAGSEDNAGVYGTSFVDGADAVTDDFGDHRAELGNSLCYGCADSQNTDLVIMWQSILYAEGYISPWDIDGQFGPKTRDATKNWQRKYGLVADGIVGNATWSVADNKLDAQWETSEILYAARDATGRVRGWVAFYRGADSNDDGAYDLRSASVNTGSWTTVYFASSNDRINFFRKTISIDRSEVGEGW